MLLSFLLSQLTFFREDGLRGGKAKNMMYLWPKIFSVEILGCSDVIGHFS
jgi:hypothetical protein